MTESDEALLARVRQLLVERFGLALTGLEARQVQQALQAARASVAQPGAEPSEALLLAVVDALPISETSLFRNSEVWEWLAHEVLPARVGELWTRAQPLRLVSLACSSGAEAFGLAIKALEAFRARGLGPEVAVQRAQVLGFDLSPARVALARTGRITTWAAQRARPDLARGWVVPDLTEPGTYRVNPDAVALCRFEQSDLADASGAALAAVAGADVVLCQNALVYFENAAAVRALTQLAAAMPPGALLVVAPVEAHLLEVVPRLEILRHIGAARVRPVDAPRAPTPSRVTPAPLPKLARPPTPVRQVPASAGEVEALLSRAMVEAAGGDLDGAIAHARQACFLEPANLMARLVLGRHLLARDPEAGRRVLAELEAETARLPAGTSRDAELSASQILGAARKLLQREER